jgi:predicted short-subunit dehydrogenase-like oxidoreductase (DUF2520 family)
MVSRVQVVGRGRVGGAFAARLAERSLLVEKDPDLVLLCVPDRAIAEVAAAIEVGPWVAHTSGATPLARLAPHQQRFSLHPLQTFSSARGAEQIDGAWGAVTAETLDGLEVGRWLASILGLRPFELKDESRVLYHAGAVFASNYLVTLYRAASRAVLAAGVPAEALTPLMQRTIENGFDLTGPIARGDWAVVDAHLATLERHLPELADLYRALARATGS